jgi:hypothetical protein
MNKYKNIIIVVSIVIILIVSGVLLYIYVIKKPNCKSNSDCSNNGECDPSGKCKCRPDFKGNDCKQRSTSGCPVGCVVPYGTCDSSTGKCKCRSGFTGEDCRIKKCPGDDGTCSSPNGSCDSSTGKCNCNDDFTGGDCKLKKCKDTCTNGTTCDYSTGKCELKKCPGDGTCSPPNGTCESGECKCINKFIGDTCTESENPELHFNTIYQLKNNSHDKFLNTCGIYPFLKNAFNVIITSTIPVYGFKLLDINDITSTSVIKTSDRFYIYDVLNDGYIQFDNITYEGDCTDPDKPAHKALSIKVNEPSRNNEECTFILTNSDESGVVNSTFTDTEYVIKLANTQVYNMDICDNNKFCTDESNVVFIRNMNYENVIFHKLWKFVI